MNDEQRTQSQNKCAAAPQSECAVDPVTPPQSPQPNLEEWIQRYGHAHIPWAEWDRAVASRKAERRAEFERKKLLERMQSTAGRRGE